MPPSNPLPGQGRLIPPGNLWARLREQGRQAQALGALHRIQTEQRWLDDQGVRFLVRALPSLSDKPRQTDPGPAPANPFLPPEPALTLGDWAPNHRMVLNKFNVLDHHLLIVTRQFEHQEQLLKQGDFAALAAALGEIDGLGFYNGGQEAGASQTHKHLQLVPLAGEHLPLEPWFEQGEGDQLAALPFRHAFRRLPAGTWRQPDQTADLLLSLYLEMLAQVAIVALVRDGELWQGAPYNLLLRRHWMLLVPRRRESFAGVSVNALGFAGSLFVPCPAALEQISRLGPFRLLTEVGAGY